ncbi:MAG: type II secretion system protein [Fibrobacter sp.]|nr:type II secretion system protein [Fibrobacter sp.]
MKKTVSGFTLIELLMVVSITGIISAIGFVKFNSSIQANHLEKNTWKVRMFLQTAKPLAMKMDSRTKVCFSASSCSLYVDTSTNGTGEWKYHSNLALHESLRFGLPQNSPPPDATLGSIGAAKPPSSKFAGGGWGTALIVSADAIGTINAGSIFISSKNLPKFTYCIRITETDQSFKIYKWTGSSWVNL